MKVTIKYTIEAPCECTQAQFKEWLKVQLEGDGNSIGSENPLYDQSLWIDLGDYSDLDITQD